MRALQVVGRVVRRARLTRPTSTPGSDQQRRRLSPSPSPVASAAAHPGEPGPEEEPMDAEAVRWKIPLSAACVVNFCTGIPIGFPFILDIMSRDIGIVGSASMDWSFTQLAAPGAVFLCLQAVTAAVAGRWQQREGHDMSLSMAAVVLGCGMGVTAAGVHLHEMSVLVAGLGGLAGVASGLAYSPVIQGVIADEPGKVGPSLGAITLATGLGAGVLPLFIDRIASVFRTLPTHLGSVADVATMEVGGKLFAAVNGLPTEVIESTGCIDAIAQGLYVVGSGSSGFAEALAVTGLAASALMFVAGQRLVVLPHAGEASTVATDKPTATNMDFHMLGIASMVSVTAGTLVLSMGPTLINEILPLVPNLMTPGASAVCAVAITASTVAGRYAWPHLTTYYRYNWIFYIITMGGLSVVLTMPILVQTAALTGSPILAGLSVVSTCLGSSIAGGLYGIVPGYLHSIFGERAYGEYVGKALLYLNGGILASFAIYEPLREFSKQNALNTFLDKITPEQFLKTFGKSIEEGRNLIASNSISLQELAALTPDGVLDPTYQIYDKSAMAISIMLALSAIMHTRVLIAVQAEPEPPRIDFSKPTDGALTSIYKVPNRTLLNLEQASNVTLKKLGIHASRKRRRVI